MNLTDYTPKGDIKDLPLEVIARMLECQVEQGNKKDVSVFEKCRNSSNGMGGFDWVITKEYETDLTFWTDVLLNNNFDLFFRRHHTHKTPQNMTNNKFPFKLMEEQAKRIIAIACEPWKDKLSTMWGKDTLMYGYVVISESFYKEMRNVCTSQQNTLFDEIFGKDEPDKVYPPSGTLVYVRNRDEEWRMRYFSHYENGVFKCFDDQQKSGRITFWNKVSTTNPLTEGETLL